MMGGMDAIPRALDSIGSMAGVEMCDPMSVEEPVLVRDCGFCHTADRRLLLFVWGLQEVIYSAMDFSAPDESVPMTENSK